MTQASDYDAYWTVLHERAIPEYRRTPGNEGVRLFRRLEGARAHFLTLSYWSSLEAIEAFAAADVALARYYPEDQRYLLEFEPTVVHYEVTERDVAGLAVDHVELFVPDRAVAAEWYARVLGCRSVPGTEQWAGDPRGPLMVSPDGGRTKLALFRDDTPGHRETTGFHRVAFVLPCPRQFEALPTHGDGRGFEVVRIDRGHFGDLRLDGLNVALPYAWPGPIFEGGGKLQVVVDARATPAQRKALLRPRPRPLEPGGRCARRADAAPARPPAANRRVAVYSHQGTTWRRGPGPIPS